MLGFHWESMCTWCTAPAIAVQLSKSHRKWNCSDVQIAPADNVFIICAAIAKKTPAAIADEMDAQRVADPKKKIPVPAYVKKVISEASASRSL